MSFSINTNIASLQAQNYLRVNSDFQAKTINEVTSGLRIVNSGDDAAGLAVANNFRSDVAVLTQGVQNASQGLSQLQIADGGLSNISQLLDRARTLATESASGTFTGDRTVLNNEFQSVLTEINRQATDVGLNTGGTFAKNLSVFIGGGKGSTSGLVITNGSVSVDLSGSTVDAQSLGLSGFSATANSGHGGTNTLAAWLTQYGGSGGGTVTIKFEGPGFSDTNPVSVTANLAGVGDINGLVTAINAGIQSAQAGGTAPAAAFKSANIVATNSNGALSFTGSKAFMAVDNGSAASQDLLNNGSAAYVYGGGTYQVASQAFTPLVASDSQTMTFSAVDASGTLKKIDVTLSGATTLANAVAQINTALQNSNISVLQNIVAVQDGANSIGFTSSTGFNVTTGAEYISSGAPDSKGFTGAVGTQAAAVSGSGATAAIDTVGGAQAAVTALSSSVTSLGRAQAVVGKGENQFNYAINLAQSQLTNFTTAESSIRDADLAAQAANLTKAQILMQAGVAALAQANAAPQAVLSLLKG